MVGIIDTKEGIRLLQLFAEILNYPGPELQERAREGVDLLSGLDSEAAALLESFLDLARELPPGSLEELYTATFELQAACHPYAGYHLFGESYKRGLFLVRLKEKFHGQGFSEGKELPDYLPVLLRFLALAGSSEEGVVLVRDCLAPVLEKMLQAFREGENPYGEVLRALLLALRGLVPEGAACYQIPEAKEV